MLTTRHVLPTWEWGGPLGKDILGHLLFWDPCAMQDQQHYEVGQ